MQAPRWGMMTRKAIRAISIQTTWGPDVTMKAANPITEKSGAWRPRVDG